MMTRALVVILLLATSLGAPACAGDDFYSTDSAPPRRDGGARKDGAPAPKLDTATCASGDADHDTIADCEEGQVDTDGDGIPDLRDPDADGDGIPDAQEAGDADPRTRAVDTDGDGTPDFKDLDSDNDGLTDAEERAMGTNPRNSDTDGDGLPDLAEKAVGTNPKDPSSKLNPGEFFVILPYQGKHQLRDLSFGSKVQKADVYFLMDTSTTMNGEIANIKSSLSSTIIPGLTKEIKDVAMGAGHFEDVPVTPYGTPQFHAYENLQNITTDTARVQTALNSLQTCCNPDGKTQPESQTIALHATATGQGLGTFFSAAPACPTGQFGHPCFRQNALPVIVLVTDALFHNGWLGSNPYDATVQPPPPTYGTMINALKAKGVKVVGVFSGALFDDKDLNHVAKDTGSVDLTGKTLVFKISASGSGLGQSVVNAVAQLAGKVARDVSTRTSESPTVNDNVDAARFIKAVRPKSANPATGFRSKDATTFYDVVAGSTLTFEVDFANDFVLPASTDKVYQAVIEVQGDKTVLLDSRRAVIIVPRSGSSIVIK